MSGYVWQPDGSTVADLAESFLCSNDEAAKPFYDEEGTHAPSLEAYLRRAIVRAAHQWADNRTTKERLSD